MGKEVGRIWEELGEGKGFDQNILYEKYAFSSSKLPSYIFKFILHMQDTLSVQSYEKLKTASMHVKNSSLLFSQGFLFFVCLFGWSWSLFSLPRDLPPSIWEISGSIPAICQIQVTSTTILRINYYNIG